MNQLSGRIDESVLKHRNNSFKKLDNLYVPSYINVIYTNPSENIIAYVTYSELFPSEINSYNIIQNEFSKYIQKDIVQSICKINYIISHKYSGKIEDVGVAKDLLKQTEVNLDIFGKNRKFFSRQQLLSNIKLAILFSKDGSLGELVKNNIGTVTKLCFRITDFLESGQEKVSKTNQNLTRLIIARNIFFNESIDFVMGLSRYNYIFNIIGKQIKYKFKNKKITLNKLFKIITGVSYDFYQAIGFTIWGFYDDNNFDKRLEKPEEFVLSKTYFKNCNQFTRKNFSKVINLISNDFRGFESELTSSEIKNAEFYSFQSFYRSPLIRDDRTFYLIDSTYLQHRLTDGVFWHIFDNQKTNDTKRSVKSYWGKLFERYVLDLCLHTYNGTDRVISEIENDKGLNDETFGVDIILNYGDTLILIEVTTQRVPYNLWISLDEDKTKNYLRKLLIRGDSRGKASQLYELFSDIKRNNFTLKDIDLTKIKRVIPIVVFEELLPMHIGIWQLYLDVLEEAGFSKEFTDELIMWSVEDLEHILGIVEKGTTIPDTIDLITKDGYKHNSIRNYMIFKNKNLIRPIFCKLNFDRFTKNKGKILFK